jgi:hypothetical protein
MRISKHRAGNQGAGMKQPGASYLRNAHSAREKVTGAFWVAQATPQPTNKKNEPRAIFESRRAILINATRVNARDKKRGAPPTTKSSVASHPKHATISTRCARKIERLRDDDNRARAHGRNQDNATSVAALRNMRRYQRGAREKTRTRPTGRVEGTPDGRRPRTFTLALAFSTAAFPKSLVRRALPCRDSPAYVPTGGPHRRLAPKTHQRPSVSHEEAFRIEAPSKQARHQVRRQK